MHRSSRYFTQHFQQATSPIECFTRKSKRKVSLQFSNSCLANFNPFKDDARIPFSAGINLCLHQYVPLCPTAIHDVVKK